MQNPKKSDAKTAFCHGGVSFNAYSHCPETLNINEAQVSQGSKTNRSERSEREEEKKTLLPSQTVTVPLSRATSCKDEGVGKKTQRASKQVATLSNSQ